MIVALSLLLAAAPVGTASLDNLALDTGRLSHWQGEGFFLTSAAAAGPSLRWAVSSSDSYPAAGTSGPGKAGRTGVLHRTLTLPPGTGALRFRAAVVAPQGKPPRGKIDVVLEAAGREMIPRLVRTAEGLAPSAALLPLNAGQAYEYYWPVDDHGGEQVRIALVDLDGRPGCSLFCTGFELVGHDDFLQMRMTDSLIQLARRRQMPTPSFTETEHFLALSTAVGELTEDHLYHCEMIHALFLPHFRRRGLPVREAPGRLALVVLDSQDSFEGYLGRRMPPEVTGFYDRESNRLVVYDYARNRTFLSQQHQTAEQLRRLRPTLRKQLDVSRQRQRARDARDDANVSTLMHEAAHQLSFSCGLLERRGDVPLWLAEGLACYCEPVTQGAWVGLGESNPRRLHVLRRITSGNGKLLPLTDLLQDGWLHGGGRGQNPDAGYAQSWALFHMLMQEQPQALARYLEVIRPRRTPRDRLTDFAAVFGPDLAVFEARYQRYLHALISEGAP